MVGEVKVSDGRDKAAAQTLEVDDEEFVFVPVGEETEALWPCRGACRCSCKAFASAFSWVRTKYARFWDTVSERPDMRATLLCPEHSHSTARGCPDEVVPPVA